MVIEYVWHDEPDRIKYYDTQKAYDKIPKVWGDRYVNSGEYLPKFGEIGHERLGKEELKRFERSKEKGLVLYYRVL